MRGQESKYCKITKGLLIAIGLWVLGTPNTISAQTLKQDTLKLTLPEVEKTFLQKNLTLLAQKYNVDATKALIIQARLWNNPNISISQGAYDPADKKWFETGTTGETAVQVSQLILLAGKIHKQVDIAKTNYLLAEYNLFDVLRNLKLTMRTDFYNIYYLQQTAKVYDEEITALKRIVAAYDQLQGKGYIAQTEVVSIKAQLYSLQSEYNDLQNQINDVQSEIRLVMQVPPTSYLIPVVDTTVLDNANPLAYGLGVLIDSANKNRTDLLIAKANITLSNQNYSYQKALAVPDLTVGAGWDKNGSYVHNASFLNLGIDLPLLNRNQGNIKSARIMMDYSKTQMELTQNTLNDQVARALQKSIDADKLYRGIDPGFASQFDRLSKAVLDNYTKRNIGLLDFLNFYDSYKQNIVQLNTILFNKVNSLENINYITGTPFFNK